MKKTISILVLVTLSICHSKGQDIIGGSLHTIALCADGSVWTWGDNNYGQLGDTSFTTLIVPNKVSTIDSAVAVFAGWHNSFVEKSDNTIWAWGRNGDGELGVDSIGNSRYPQKVVGLSDVTKIDGGAFHTLALKDDGTVWAWGDNSRGQLGDGNSTVDQITPIQVPGFDSIITIDAGWNHSLALKDDGTIWVWGQNEHGELGDSTYLLKDYPIKVQGLTNMLDVKGGGWHSVALRNDSTVWTWGFNDFGQLGNGNLNTTPWPVQVVGLSGIVSIESGRHHSFALDKDGVLWGWGYNFYNSLGTTSPPNQSTPIQASLNPKNYILSSGDWHSFAIDNNNIWTWGRNNYGQLGDSTYTNKSIPYIRDDFCLSVTSMENGMKLIFHSKVFPNPFVSETHIRTHYPTNISYTLTIMNSMGQQVKQIEGSNASDILVVRENLPCGMYIYQLTTSKGEVATGKLIAE